MTPDVGPVSVTADADALEALEKMQRTGSSRLVVTHGNQLVGIVSLKDLLRFLNLKLELQDGEDILPQHGDSRRERTREQTLVHH